LKDGSLSRKRTDKVDIFTRKPKRKTVKDVLLEVGNEIGVLMTKSNELKMTEDNLRL